MATFNSLPRDLPDQQADAAQPSTVRSSGRRRLVVIVSLLLLIALVGVWAYLTFWADTAPYERVVWECNLQGA